MPKPRTVIIDPDIACREVSRQRKLQLQWRRYGRCESCGAEREEGLRALCLPCLIVQRERHRKKLHYVRENDCKTRRMEKELSARKATAELEIVGDMEPGDWEPEWMDATEGFEEGW
jgi:hypothetical protein